MKEFNCKFDSKELAHIPEEHRSFKILLLERTKDGLQLALAPTNAVMLFMAPLIMEFVQISIGFFDHIETIEEIDDMENNIFTKEDSIYLFNLMHEVHTEMTLKERLQKELQTALDDENYEEACVLKEKISII